jgi:tripartite-type tricarboxylate transporter receptor subunit TctC
VIEAGFPNLVAEDWVGFVVKSGAPADYITILNMAVNRALGKSSVRAALGSLGYEPSGGTPEKLGSLISAQFGYWSDVIHETGIKLPQ